MPDAWTTRLCFHFLRVGIVNAWIIFQLVKKNNITLAQFRSTVAKEWLNISTDDLSDDSADEASSFEQEDEEVCGENNDIFDEQVF